MTKIKIRDVIRKSEKVAQVKKKKNCFLKKTILTILLVLLGGLLFLVLPAKSITDADEVPYAPIGVAEQQKVLSGEQLIVTRILDTFPEVDPAVMVAIAIQESNLNPKAISYNCYYRGYWQNGKPIITDRTPLANKTSGTISWICDKEHRQSAWSKDGGLFQVNKPKEKDFNLEGNLITARERYEDQGLNAWSSYKLGHYKKHLPRAKELVQELSTI